MEDHITKFVSEVMPQMTLDQIEVLMETFGIQLNSPPLKEERRIQFENLKKEAEEERKITSQLADDLRKERMKVLQENILSVLSLGEMTYRSLINSSFALSYSNLDIKEQLRILISEGKVINEDDLYFKS